MRAAVDHDENTPDIEAPHGRFRVAWMPRQPEPQHVHRRTELAYGQPGRVAHDRVAAIGAYDEVGMDLQRPLGARGVGTYDAASIPDKSRNFCLHEQFEARIRFGVLDQE